MSTKEYGGHTLEQLKGLLEKAFKRPWTYRRFEIDFEHDDYNCDEGTEVIDTIEVEAPDEYPEGQCVCQQNVILVPGLERFAEANGALICGAVNSLEELIADLTETKKRYDAIIAMAKSKVSWVKEHATVDSGWMLEREYQGMLDVCEDILDVGVPNQKEE